MKNHFLIIIFLILGIIFMNCENIINSKENKDTNNYNNPYNQYGELHNNCVDFVFNYMETNSNIPSESMNINEKYKFVEIGCELFAKENSIQMDININDTNLMV